MRRWNPSFRNYDFFTNFDLIVISKIHLPEHFFVKKRSGTLKLDKKLSKRDRTIIFLLRNRSDQCWYIQNFSDWGDILGIFFLSQKSKNYCHRTFLTIFGNILDFRRFREKISPKYPPMWNFESSIYELSWDVHMLGLISHG